MRPGWHCALAVSLASGACDKPLPPPVAVREPSLDADDLAVVKALFDDLRRDRNSGAAEAQPLARAFSSWIRRWRCARAIPRFSAPQPGRCLESSRDQAPVRGRARGPFATATLDFPAWNATRCRTGPLGDDVTYSLATLLDSWLRVSCSAAIAR